MKVLSLLLVTFAAVALAGDGTCWLRSYGRGVGKPLHVCANNLEQNGALCYDRCRDGYHGVGPVCWQRCPDRYRDDGAFCYKPSPYGRGAGYALWSKGKCEKDHSQGCEKSGLIWYPKCNDGFHATGCCICSPNCPSGMTDIGISCAKGSYGRGAGHPLKCSGNEQENAGLCYRQCSNGYHGIGPVCWGSCPAGMDGCGALCVPKGKCASNILNMAKGVFEGIAKIASSVATENFVGVAQYSAQTIAKLAGGLTHPICP